MGSCYNFLTRIYRFIFLMKMCILILLSVPMIITTMVKSHHGNRGGNDYKWDDHGSKDYHGNKDYLVNGDDYYGFETGWDHGRKDYRGGNDYNGVKPKKFYLMETYDDLTPKKNRKIF